MVCYIAHHRIWLLWHCRFFQNGRVELWGEKVGIGEPFKGNAATEWGTKKEPVAQQRYLEVTGHRVTPDAFKILDDGNSLINSWLGASPDGLILESSSPGDAPLYISLLHLPRARRIHVASSWSCPPTIPSALPACQFIIQQYDCLGLRWTA